MTYAQLRLLGSVQKHGGGGRAGQLNIFSVKLFDPLHKSQNFLNPLNKSKKPFLKPRNSAICCKIQI